MHRIEVTTLVAAPPKRCFDLARSVDVHVRTVGQSGERAIGGRTSGLLELGEEVTWEGSALWFRSAINKSNYGVSSPALFPRPDGPRGIPTFGARSLL